MDTVFLAQTGYTMELCLVCCSKVSPKSQDALTSKLLESNLFVIFLLKQVLQVPDSQLEENLKESGNPVEWIRLCEQCTRLASQALNLHCQIVKLDRELWAVQKLLVEKTKQSSTQLVPSNQSENIWAWRRDFVKTSACHQVIGSLPVNPFIQGDKLATSNYYLSQQISIAPFPSPFELNKQDNLGEKLACTPQVKTDQLNPQSISDDEDDNWQMEDNDSDQANLNHKSPKKKPNNHRRRTKVNGKLKCNFCSKLFSTSSGCSKHEQEKHASIPNQYPCRLCGKAWNSREYLRKHMARMHKARLNDDRASISKRRGQARRLHLLRQIKGPELRVDGKSKCHYCNKLFSRRSGCLRHESEVHPSIPAQFPCDICGKAWNSREYLTNHRRSVHKIGGLPKIDCSFKSEDGDDHAFEMPCSSEPASDNQEDDQKEDEEVLKLPETEPEDEKLEENLEDCKLDDANDKNEEHSENEDEENVQNIIEEAIGKLKLERRMSENEEENGKEKGKRFSCRICGKAFKDRYHLQRHERTFRGKMGNEKRFSCELCESRFVSRGCFKWHKCQKHGATFSGNTKKGTSQVVPKKEKEENKETSKMPDVQRRRSAARKLEWVDGKVKCAFCEKGFKSKQSLVAHETTHKFHELMKKNDKEGSQGEREECQDFVKLGIRQRKKYEWVDGKVKCGQCDKLLSRPSCLYKHEKAKHPKNPGQFICDLCGKTWDCYEYLLGHRNRAHGVKADGSPYLSKFYNPKKKREEKREGYGLPLPDGKGVRGRKYEAVDGKLKCRYCDRLFLSPDGAYKHEREKHPKNPGSFICTTCGMAFNSLEYLRVHSERKHWLKLDGTQYIPHWVPTRKYKWKKSEN